MGVVNTASMMPLLWGLNGFALSLTWCPIMKLFAERLQKEDRITVSVHFETCSIVGYFCSYLMCSAIVYVANWKWVFFVAAVILLLSSVLWTFGMKKVISHADEYGVIEEEEKMSLTSTAIDECSRIVFREMYDEHSTYCGKYRLPVTGCGVQELYSPRLLAQG